MTGKDGHDRQDDQKKSGLLGADRPVDQIDQRHSEQAIRLVGPLPFEDQ